MLQVTFHFSCMDSFDCCVMISISDFHIVNVDHYTLMSVDSPSICYVVIVPMAITSGNRMSQAVDYAFWQTPVIK